MSDQTTGPEDAPAVEPSDPAPEAMDFGGRAALWTLVLGLLTTVALVAAPHAYIEDQTAAGTVTEMRFWWDQVAWDAEHGAVAGGSAVLALLAAVTVSTGAVLGFLGLRRGRKGLALGATATLLAGALPAIVYSALWTSRLLTTLVHTVAGYDAPAALLQLDLFVDDAYSGVWTIGPVVVLGLTLATSILATRALAGSITGIHDLRPQARRHLRAAALGLVVLALLFALPWSIQTLPDNPAASPGAAVDDDAFWFGAYDALRIHEGTLAVAQETNAGAGIQYGELLQMLWIGLAATALMVLAALLAVHGTGHAAAGDRNLGNTWQASVYAGILGSVALFAVTLLAGFWLHRPNADVPDRGTFLPLLAFMPLFLALMSQIGAARQLAGESQTLLADDFPEPIVYD